LPLSVVLVGRAEQETLVPAGTGYAVYAWLLEELRCRNGVLAAAIHDASGLKPVTVSSLRGDMLGDGTGMLRTRPGGTVWLRVTAMEPAIEAGVWEVLAAAVGGVVELHGLRLHPLRAARAPDEHPWAAHADYPTLFDGALASPPPEVLELEFASPTTFRSGGHNLPLPVPVLVWRSLVQRWNRFSPIQLGEFQRVLEEGVRVQRYVLRTHHLNAGGHGEVGFTGRVAFDLRGVRDPLVRRAAGALAHFALYAGVGAKTVFGFGQARLVGAVGGAG